MAMRVERGGDRYQAFEGDHVVWSVVLEADLGGSPFREELLWPAASVFATGGGGVVRFFAMDTGAIVKTLQLEGDLFGHFSEAPR